MNFEQANLGTAFLAAIGFLGYGFYMMIKEQRVKKEKPAYKMKKQENPKPAPDPARENTFVKATHTGTSIVSAVSDIQQICGSGEHYKKPL